MGGSEERAADHLYAYPEALQEQQGAGVVEYIEGFTRAEGDAFEAELRRMYLLHAQTPFALPACVPESQRVRVAGELLNCQLTQRVLGGHRYDWEAIAAAKPAPLLDEADEEDLAAGLSFSLRERFELTGSNLYALATQLLDNGVRSVEQFEALRTEYVSTLGFSSSDEEKIAAAKTAQAEAQALAAAEGSALTPAQEKMLEEAYDRKDGGVRFQVCGCLLLAPASRTWLLLTRRSRCLCGGAYRCCGIACAISQARRPMHRPRRGSLKPRAILLLRSPRRSLLGRWSCGTASTWW